MAGRCGAAQRLHATRRQFQPRHQFQPRTSSSPGITGPSAARPPQVGRYSQSQRQSRAGPAIASTWLRSASSSASSWASASIFRFSAGALRSPLRSHGAGAAPLHARREHSPPMMSTANAPRSESDLEQPVRKRQRERLSAFLAGDGDVHLPRRAGGGSLAHADHRNPTSHPRAARRRATHRVPRGSARDRWRCRTRSRSAAPFPSMDTHLRAEAAAQPLLEGKELCVLRLGPWGAPARRCLRDALDRAHR